MSENIETMFSTHTTLWYGLGESIAEAPDLAHVGKNVYKFVNAVSDFATHAEPLRHTSTYRENLFLKIVKGNALIDRGCGMVKVA